MLDMLVRGGQGDITLGRLGGDGRRTNGGIIYRRPLEENYLRERGDVEV